VKRAVLFVVLLVAAWYFMPSVLFILTGGRSSG
jgi:hypothetical protein